MSPFAITAFVSMSAKRAIFSRMSCDSVVARAADDDVRMDTDATQLVHRVLRRLRLQLSGRLDERHERDVNVDDVLRPLFAPKLADRLEERQRLDVADGAADLRDDDVGVRGLRDAADPVLDLVRDVRDDLDGRAEVLALALLADDRVPDRPGRVVCVAGEVLVDEPLVVADVEIGLGAVLGDEHLAVLVRAHRPRIDVDVRVELLDLDLQAARLQQRAERGGGDALPERRDDAAGDEHVLRPPTVLLRHGQTRPARSIADRIGARSIQPPSDDTLAEDVDAGESRDGRNAPTPRVRHHGLQA